MFFPWCHGAGACKPPSEWSGAPSLAVIEAEVNDSKMPVLSSAITMALLWLVHWASNKEGLDGCCSCQWFYVCTYERWVIMSSIVMIKDSWLYIFVSSTDEWTSVTSSPLTKSDAIPSGIHWGSIEFPNDWIIADEVGFISIQAIHSLLGGDWNHGLGLWLSILIGNDNTNIYQLGLEHDFYDFPFSWEW